MGFTDDNDKSNSDPTGQLPKSIYSFFTTLSKNWSQQPVFYYTISQLLG